MVILGHRTCGLSISSSCITSLALIVGLRLLWVRVVHPATHELPNIVDIVSLAVVVLWPLVPMPHVRVGWNGGSRTSWYL